MEAYQIISPLEQFERDKKVKQAGFVIALPGELYTLTLSRTSAVYIEKIGSQWQAWRETYKGHKEKAVSYKVIAVSESFELVLLKAKNYMDYIAMKRGK